jgi:hypothetical protein
MERVLSYHVEPVPRRLIADAEAEGTPGQDAPGQHLTGIP